MRDEDKTREQLINELVELRRQNADLKALAAEHKLMEGRQPPKIGQILMEMGYVTMPQLEICLQKQKEAYRSGARRKLLGEIMVESGIITVEQLLQGLAEQLARLRLKKADH